MTIKYFPQIGDKLYLRRFTGDEYSDLVKFPYTVVAVTRKTISVQACKLIAPVYHCCGNPNLDRPDLEGQRVFFFNTVAETIEPDPDGAIEELTWHSKRKLWGTAGRDDDYPYYAIFGEYVHYPYLR